MADIKTSAPWTEDRLLRSLENWLREHHPAWMMPHFDPLIPFHRLRPDWKRRFLLRDDLLPWIRDNVGLPDFYPDELRANARPFTLVRSILRRMGPDSVPHDCSPDKHSIGLVGKPTIFLLGCPRSGTTLLRSMLMGHPEIFAGPELHLMQYDSLLQRERAITDSGRSWMTMGLAQTFAAMRGWDITRAFQYLTHITRLDMPVEHVYRLLHVLNPKQYLVDKSPTLTAKPATLQSIERRFQSPYYIHIIRHPVPVVDSMMRMQINPPYPKHSSHSAQEEWRNDNRNALDHLATIPDERQVRIRFEDLVTDPECQLRRICSMLHLELHPGMENPYDGTRMLDGVGCVNLPKRSAVDKTLAFDWKTSAKELTLEIDTIQLGRELCFDV
jgi:hypothetical protein